MQMEDMKSDLAHLITHYVSQASRRTLRALAKDSQLGYSTVKRLSIGQGKPTYDTVLKILKSMMDERLALAKITTYFPQYHELFHDDAPPQLQTDLEPIIAQITKIPMCVQKQVKVNKVLSRALEEIHRISREPSKTGAIHDMDFVLLFQKKTSV